MADDIDKDKEGKEPEVIPETPETPEPDAPSQEEQMELLKTLAEAEKARADAAEALIVKHKSIQKRKGGEGGDEPQALTEERVRELIKESRGSDDSPESKALEEAEKNLRELKAKSEEIARALKSKETPARAAPGTKRDGEPKLEPKLPEGSPLKSYTHVGNGVYSKKLANGKTLFINTKATANEPKKWVS